MMVTSNITCSDAVFVAVGKLLCLLATAGGFPLLLGAQPLRRRLAGSPCRVIGQVALRDAVRPAACSRNIVRSALKITDGGKRHGSRCIAPDAVTQPLPSVVDVLEPAPFGWVIRRQGCLSPLIDHRHFVAIDAKVRDTHHVQGTGRPCSPCRSRDHRRRTEHRHDKTHHHRPGKSQPPLRGRPRATAGREMPEEPAPENRRPSPKSKTGRQFAAPRGARQMMARFMN